MRGLKGFLKYFPAVTLLIRDLEVILDAELPQVTSLAVEPT